MLLELNLERNRLYFPACLLSRRRRGGVAGAGRCYYFVFFFCLGGEYLVVIALYLCFKVVNYGWSYDVPFGYFRLLGREYGSFLG